MQQAKSQASKRQQDPNERIQESEPLQSMPYFFIQVKRNQEKYSVYGNGFMPKDFEFAIREYCTPESIAQLEKWINNGIKIMDNLTEQELHSLGEYVLSFFPLYKSKFLEYETLEETTQHFELGKNLISMFGKFENIPQDTVLFKGINNSRRDLNEENLQVGNIFKYKPCISTTWNLSQTTRFIGSSGEGIVLVFKIKNNKTRGIPVQALPHFVKTREECEVIISPYNTLVVTRIETKRMENCLFSNCTCTQQFRKMRLKFIHVNVLDWDDKIDDGNIYTFDSTKQKYISNIPEPKEERIVLD